MFKESLEEFDESRGVVDDLVQEYQAAATPDYVHWNPGLYPPLHNKGNKHI